MPITPPALGTPSASVSSLKLVEVSRLKLPAQPLAHPVPLPIHTEKVSLHSAAQNLSDAEQAEIHNLKARDAQVRQHEKAHLAASAGVDVSKAAFTYQRGPDGVQYAVGGDVRIDTSPGRTPEDSLARGEMIIDIALAPADPSPADRSAAAKGQNMAQQARAELLQQSRLADVHDHGGARQAVSKAYDAHAPAIKKIDTFV